MDESQAEIPGYNWEVHGNTVFMRRPVCWRPTVERGKNEHGIGVIFRHESDLGSHLSVERIEAREDTLAALSAYNAFAFQMVESSDELTQDLLLPLSETKGARDRRAGLETREISSERWEKILEQAKVYYKELESQYEPPKNQEESLQSLFAVKTKEAQEGPSQPSFLRRYSPHIGVALTAAAAGGSWWIGGF